MTVTMLFFILLIVVVVESAEISVPRNFTRSRYSQRKSPLKSVLVANDTIVQVPANSEENEKIEQEIVVTPLSDPTVTSVFDATESLHQCGIRTSDNNHPWIVVLEHTDPTGRSVKKTISKGVLISANHVLTTVSSVHNSRPFWTVSKVRLGDAPTGDTADSSTIRRIAVAEIFSHKHKDIAIVKLAESVTFSKMIAPICLPDDDYIGYADLELHMCKRSGKSFKVPPQVTSVMVTPLKSRDCFIMLQRKNAKLTHTEFCAWDETGDSCTGDLGGPLVGRRVDGRFRVVGLNSYVNTKNEIQSTEYPGIYARVGSHLKWIRTVRAL